MSQDQRSGFLPAVLGDVPEPRGTNVDLRETADGRELTDKILSSPFPPCPTPGTDVTERQSVFLPVR